MYIYIYIVCIYTRVYIVAKKCRPTELRSRNGFTNVAFFSGSLRGEGVWILHGVLGVSAPRDLRFFVNKMRGSFLARKRIFCVTKRFMSEKN